jgi:hypothetical protein
MGIQFPNGVRDLHRFTKLPNDCTDYTCSAWTVSKVAGYTFGQGCCFNVRCLALQ